MEVRATKDQIEEFKESFLWQDFVAELEHWRDMFPNEMYSIVETAADDNPSTANVLMHMGDINGRNKAIDYMLGLPDMFLELLKLESEENEDE